MNTPLSSILATFLNRHYIPNSPPLLLALSGGPDSLALLHLLYAYQIQYPTFAFGVAHVDHGWRPESGEEAVELQKMAKALGVPFHLKKLSPESMQGNLESACRQLRLEFFSELCRSKNYQAVLLAHHADDQSETVLKRLLEGASFPACSGILPVTQWNDLIIWRPLLGVTKDQIELWLVEQNLVAFQDQTNLDPKFLRGRFRTRIIPLLAQEFGKDIRGNLYALGAEAQEIREFFLSHLTPILDQIVQGPLGIFLDLSDVDPMLSPAELKFLIREICQLEQVHLSKQQIQLACDQLQIGGANCQIASHPKSVFVDRKRLFILRFHPDSDGKLPLQLSSFDWGAWHVSVTESAFSKREVSDWKSVWKGHLQCVLPKGNYQIGPASSQAPYRLASSLDKWWTKHKIPAFLRYLIPVIWSGEFVIHEYLTGEQISLSSIDLNESCLVIQMHIK